MEALDPASFRAGEPTSRQGLRVEVGARRGDGDGKIRDAHLVAAREAVRDCTPVIRAVERSLFSGRNQDGRVEPLPARRRTVEGGRARRAGRDAARRPGIRHVPGATLTLIEVKKFSNLDDTDRPCWIPALAVRRDTRVRSPRHGWYAHARRGIDAEEDRHQDLLESQACLLVSYRPLARPKRTRKINVQLNAIAATKTTITSYRLVPSRSSLL